MVIESTGRASAMRRDRSGLDWEGPSGTHGWEGRGFGLLSPLSLPYTDLQGRVLQLWKYGVELIASVLGFECAGSEG